MGVQGGEYYVTPYSIADSRYGSTFFLLTGFHGRHVLIGVLILVVRAGRLVKGHYSPSHHVGLEAGIWYWHFVDVVWLGLFTVVYWWGR